MAEKLWTITSLDGEVLAFFADEESARLAFSSDATLEHLIEQYQEETEREWCCCGYEELRVCRDGVVMEIH
jgi:hypothetical protein